MRLATFAALALLVGCGPGVDPLIGSYNFTMAGTDTNTAPNTTVTTSTNTGTMAITANAASTGYVITVGHIDTNVCVLDGKATEKATGPEITITPDQKCTFVNGASTATATIAGKAVLTLKDTRAMDTMAIDVTYSYAGTTYFLTFATNFAGTGKRTYSGTRR